MKKFTPIQKLVELWRVRWAGLANILRTRLKVFPIKPLKAPQLAISKYTVRWMMMGATIVLTVLGMVGLGLAWKSSSAEGSGIAGTLLAGTGTPQATYAVEDPLALALRNELDDPGLSDVARDGVQEKLEMASRMATEQAAGAAQPQTTKIAPTLEPGASGFLNINQYTEGIFEGSQGLIKPDVAQIVNTWQGMVQGRLWQVFAGAPADHSEMGILILYIEDPMTMRRAMETANAPGQTGKLKILAVDQDKGEMTLETPDGKKLYFTLTTRTFHE